MKNTFCSLWHTDMLAVSSCFRLLLHHLQFLLIVFLAHSSVWEEDCVCPAVETSVSDSPDCH